MKTYKIIKTFIYIILGILIFIFHEKIMDYLKYIVGSAILLFGIDKIIESIIDHNLFGEKSLFLGTIDILIGISLFLVKEDIGYICMIWAVWSIIREGKEISESVHHIIHKRIGFLNLAESITIIVLSFMMILTPTHHHAHLHVIILGVELLLEIFFPHFEHLIEKCRESKNTTNN